MFLSVVLFLSFLYSSLSVSSAGSSDVQYAHLVAAIGISDMQYGQIFVAGAAGASSSFLSSFSVLEARLFITFTKQKITSAIRRKLITAVIKLPYLIVSFSPDPIHMDSSTRLRNCFRRCGPLPMPVCSCFCHPLQGWCISAGTDGFVREA